MKPRDLSRLTRKLADESACVSFRSQCHGHGGDWYSIPSPADRDEHLSDVLRYLRARGMLERNYASGHYRMWEVA